MRVYYRGADAVVTATQLIWRGDGGPYVFRLSELSGISRSRSPARRPATGWYAAAAVAALALTLTAAARIGNASVWMVGAVLTVVLVALTWRAATTRTLWEVRATYQGAEVTVYASHDDRVFHQVARALRRAVEDPGRPD